MKLHHLSAVALAAATIISATAASRQADQVVMTVNGKDIKKSEFEYLYRKNAQQQDTPQSITDYVDMFVIYKLKVADAEAAGLDTTAAFRDEYNGYCAELAAPYLIDPEVEPRLVDEAYSRMLTTRKVSHIMLPLGTDKAQRAANRQRLDSIRTAILAGADFADMARRYSVDRSAQLNGGDQGYITGGEFPYPFETATYTTPVGQISEVFEDAPYGFHIVKVIDEKPAHGRVSARHILKLTQGLSPEQAKVKRAQIDSIYALLKAGADFETLAREQSEDPGSAANGGNLGFFGRGMMVPEFEAAAFSLEPGQISEPFATSYGYHIVQTLEYEPIPDLEKVRPAILNGFKRDSRANMPLTSYLAKVRADRGFAVDPKALSQAYGIIASEPERSKAIEGLSGSSITLVRIPGHDVTAASVAALIGPGEGNLELMFDDALDRALDDATLLWAREQLANTNPDYYNLSNEYRDGILLFEISNRKVWDRASQDTDAQEAYFKAHRDRYTWDQPRFKGCVIFATSDSIASEARGYLAANHVEADSLMSAMRDRFGSDIKVERVLTARGDNAIIDEIAFQGPKADPVAKWVAWFPYDYRIIDAPETAADVRGPLSADLQQYFEQQWTTDLRKRYKVKINKKEIDKITKQENEKVK